MQKTVTYLYPDDSRASSLKVFQDRTNQIKAFYFTKDSIEQIVRMETATNYAVYFLFDNSEEDAKKVYVGQSMNGVSRIFEHARSKNFWTYCIMFVTDNNSFDKLAIDYMEYEFIKIFKKSSYLLVNKDLRVNEPNISIYDKPNIDAYIKQITFLLKAEGVETSGDRTAGADCKKRYYSPERPEFKGSVFVEDGHFVLLAGSEITRPIESSKNWRDSGRFYNRLNGMIDGYLENEKAEIVDGKLFTKVNIAFRNPSTPACLISGRSQNGWKFFAGLVELRQAKPGEKALRLED